MRWLIVLAVGSTLVWNGLAALLPLNGLETGDISDRFRVYFTPSGYVFSIWSLIYAGLIAYAVYQWAHRERRASLRSIEIPVLASCALNIGWLSAWHYELFRTSMVVMIALLGSLVVIYKRLRMTEPGSSVERWTTDATFSLYVGWVSVATLANLAVVLDAAQARPFGWDAMTWALLTTIVAGAVAAAVAAVTRDVIYLGVFVWAVIGIAVKPDQPMPMIVAPAIVAVSLAALGAWMLARPRGRGLDTSADVFPQRM